MLEAARAKARRAKVEIALVRANAAHLPLRPGLLDAIGSSFALRNLTYRNPGADRHLSEACRALRPGGRWVMVETSQPPGTLVGRAFHSYVRMVPLLGGLVSANRGAYRYLASSALGFFTAEEVSRLLLEAGFQEVTFRRLMWGAIAIHTAIR
jgi:demethylmenaquinone methyltransferase/2-methoxy-6-polyprenyl-1,4-benzoquinol methylase